MTRHRLRTRLASCTAAISLLVGLVAAPAALAAPANVIANGGLDADAPATSGATPIDGVSLGKVAGFYVTVKNNDTSNLPTFFMTAASNATPVGAFWFDTGSSTAHACTTSPLRCDFGTFGSGREVTVVAGFTVPSGASSSFTNCQPATPKAREFGFRPDPSQPGGPQSWTCVDFKFASDQGNVPGPNKSRGDEFHWFDFVRTDVNARDEAAQFPYCDLSVTPSDPSDCTQSLLTLSNNTSLSKNGQNPNRQSTKITVPASAFDSEFTTSALHVADGGTFDLVGCTGTSDCATTAAAAGGFVSETSLIEANSGQSFVADYIQTTMTMIGVQASQIDGVVHQLDNDNFEFIGKCPSSAGPDSTTPGAGCFWATGSGNTAIVNIWTHTNGKLKAF